MKKILLFLFIMLLVSCSSLQLSSAVQSDTYGWRTSSSTWEKICEGDTGTFFYNSGLCNLRVLSFPYIFNGSTWEPFRTMHDSDFLITNATRTSSGSTGAFPTHGAFKTVLCQANVTAVSGTSPTLDIFMDTTTDAGNNWINILHFSQFTTTGRRAANISEVYTGSNTDFDVTTDLAAGTVRHGAWAGTLRLRWNITGTTPSFTFSVPCSFKN